jgi:hypothetical protein
MLIEFHRRGEIALIGVAHPLREVEAFRIEVKQSGLEARSPSGTSRWNRMWLSAANVVQPCTLRYSWVRPTKWKNGVADIKHHKVVAHIHVAVVVSSRVRCVSVR